MMLSMTADVSVADERKSIRRVIAASSAGTLIEWYDFYIFGALAAVLGSQFFPKDKGIAEILSVLATFAVGFLVRPFGALVFGRMGDLVGRKVTFLLTLVMMGAATFAIGLLPSYAQIGWLAPAILLVLRVVQGLALGGEYGGAATYVAEHSPPGQRGYYTSFIQTTATLGLFVSLLVILSCRIGLGEAAFNQWGWRIPFLLSIVLVLISARIRMKMHESPEFAALKAGGNTSKNPLRESFVNPENRRLVLLALFGATAGQGVIWYTGQFYALFFLTTVLKVDMVSANTVIAAALILGTPFFIVFGKLSDRIGRLKLMMLACALAVLLYVPIYALKSSVVKSATSGVVAGSSSVRVDRSKDPVTQTEKAFRIETKSFESGATEAIRTPVDPKNESAPIPDGKVTTEYHLPTVTLLILGLLVFAQVILVTMVYGPIAAFLVELFPTRIRYTSMSLPYHLGNGVFGGLVPLISLWMVSATGQPLAGLVYPIAIALITWIVGGRMLKPIEEQAA